MPVLNPSAWTEMDLRHHHEFIGELCEVTMRTIRKARVEDFGSLVEIEYAANGRGDAWTWEDFKYWVNKLQARVAVSILDTGEIAGHVVYCFNDREKIVELVHCSVHPDYQRQGVGKSLLAWLYRTVISSEHQRIVVETSEWDTKKHIFLRSCGFVAYKVRRNWYEDGTDAYFFKKMVESVEKQEH